MQGRNALELPNLTLHFIATAGSIPLRNGKGALQAEAGFVACQLDGADRQTRPVTFALNVGPGAACGWLDVGAIGPWRVALHTDADQPAASPPPAANAETWLDMFYSEDSWRAALHRDAQALCAGQPRPLGTNDP